MEVFFYGLFMDTDILLKNGIKATDARKGYLDHYVLKIGNRASLLPEKGARSWGLLMKVDAAALQALYAEASVADYVPEKVNIVIEGGQTVEGFCYNLPAELMTGTNEVYAQSLYQLALKLDFPEPYLQRILEMAGEAQ